MGLFDKKFCSVCGEKIGFLGNRKLEDGNLCKDCAGKLSPFFSERRQSTVEGIKEQLAYRETNREDVAAFNTTRTFGDTTKILLDDDAGKFMVTSDKDLAAANPDVIDLAQVTGCKVDVDESHIEVKRSGSDGKMYSYNPPRYDYSYKFNIIINVKADYFDEIRFRLNRSSVELHSTGGMTPDPRRSVDYCEYETMGREIVAALTKRSTDARKKAEEAAKPRASMKCPYCGAVVIPDENGKCEFCGSVIGL